MWKLIIVWVLMGAPSLLATKTSCWDGSYNYKVVSIEEVSGNVFIGIRGTGLVNKAPEQCTSNSAFDLSSFYFIYLSFKETECQKHSESISCSASGPEGNVMSNRVYVGKANGWEDNSTNSSKIDVVKIEVNFINKYLSANIWHNSSNSSNIDFHTSYCAENGWISNTNFGTAYFPDSIRSTAG